MINEDVEIRMQCHYHIRNLPLFSEGDLSNRYIFLCLQEKREIKDAGHGISTIHATQEKMEPLAVPLPPPWTARMLSCLGWKQGSYSQQAQSRASLSSLIPFKAIM